MSRPNYIDKRGSASDRRARRAWLLATFSPELGPERAHCAMKLSVDCLGVVDATTLSVDRIVMGGSYEHSNIRPGCKPCQDRQGGLASARGGNAWLIETYRDARDARDALRESDAPVPSSVPGTAHANIAMHQLEDDEFREHVPALTFKEVLIEQRAARLAREDYAS